VKSIRIFLVVVLLATITLTVFLSALHGYRSSMAEAQQLFDIKLSDTAHLLAATSATGLTQQRAITTAGQFAFQVWQDGRLIQHSANVPATPIAHFEPGYQHSNFNNYRWRIFAYPGSMPQRWVFTAERVDLRDKLAEDIIMESVLPVVASLPPLGLLIWLIVGYGLSPLRQLARQLRDKRADDLGALPVDRQPNELKQLIISTNDLLHRLEASFTREKYFASDAAHELRTPISALKVHLHNLAQDLPEGHHDLQQVQQSVERMGKLIEQILTLNRTTPDLYMANFTAVDLHALIQNHIADNYSRFEEKNHSVELYGHPTFLQGDRFALQTLVQNLLDNACKYTPAGGQIRVSADTCNGNVVLIVEDSGPGIPDEQHERIFDRFYRIGGDQHNSGVIGCGLGLSIVQHIAELHHATITLQRSAALGGLSVSVTFPAPPAQPNRTRAATGIDHV
jgi:two-component system sensor histidine kinase QseC